MRRLPLNESSSSLTIHARRPIYFILGSIWIFIALLCLLLYTRFPEEGYEIAAVFFTVIAVFWWAWLLRVRLTISRGYLEYRAGIFKLTRTALKGIEEIRNEKTAPGLRLPDRIPRVMVLNRKGDISMIIDPRPFDRGDLDTLMQVLKEISWGSKAL